MHVFLTEISKKNNRVVVATVIVIAVPQSEDFNTRDDADCWSHHAALFPSIFVCYCYVDACIKFENTTELCELGSAYSCSSILLVFVTVAAAWSWSACVCHHYVARSIERTTCARSSNANTCKHMQTGRKSHAPSFRCYTNTLPPLCTRLDWAMCWRREHRKAR